MKNFPEHYQELTAWMEKLGMVQPEVMKGFGALHAASTSKGALDGKTKELIALGIAITVRCDGCISFHVHDAMQSGASADEIAETVSVARRLFTALKPCRQSASSGSRGCKHRLMTHSANPQSCVTLNRKGLRSCLCASVYRRKSKIMNTVLA